MNTLTTILAQAADEEVVLTAAGAIIMTLCVGLVLGLNIFCLARILRPSRPSQHDHASLDLDTHDAD